MLLGNCADLERNPAERLARAARYTPPLFRFLALLAECTQILDAAIGQGGFMVVTGCSFAICKDRLSRQARCERKARISVGRNTVLNTGLYAYTLHVAGRSSREKPGLGYFHDFRNPRL
jgi:hypothetical protein